MVQCQDQDITQTNAVLRLQSTLHVISVLWDCTSLYV